MQEYWWIGGGFIAVILSLIATIYKTGKYAQCIDDLKKTSHAAPCSTLHEIKEIVCGVEEKLDLLIDVLKSDAHIKTAQKEKDELDEDGQSWD